MTTISKLSTWTAFPPYPTAADVTAEFNQILNLLSGGSSNRRVYIVTSDGTLPPLRLNQENVGKILDIQLSGTSKLSVDYLGALISTVTTGTAPMTVASTTKVTNLNVDLFDDLTSSQVVRNETAAQQVKSAFTLVAANSGENLVFTLDANVLTVTRSSDSATIFSMTGLDSATRVLVLPSTLQCQTAFTPTASTDLATKTELDAETGWTPVGWLENNRVIKGTWICQASSFWKVTRLQAALETGGNALDDVITFYKNGVSMGTVTIPAASSANVVFANDIADVNLVADDILKAALTAGTNGDNVVANFRVELQ